MLVDEITIRLEAGHGGRGAAAFQKVRLAQGPTGGDGGNGGAVYFEGVADVGALTPLANRKVARAEDGGNGRGQFIDGPRGADLVLKVPTGTSVTNLETGYMREISSVGERLLCAGGGVGGRGNFKFRSPTNTTPKQYEEGKPGDVATFRLELRLIADVGLIGLPNAGKSSLLNELTRAQSKVANYAFTTLEPHLGSYYGLIIADIPGLIEGASQGKGLGVKFLKHIERTKTLFHLISAESADPVRDYGIIRKELETYGATLAEKKEYVLLTKSDAVAPDHLAQTLEALKKAGITARPISVLEPESLEEVKKVLNIIKEGK
ncbi:GTPase ObgE [Candidatus Kaiserbacteria bacterium]|nr:GTPase ObgE [Candidatus Kaiserbacteria bacterium]